MNVNILSVDELITYIENGTIESVPAVRVLEIIEQVTNRAFDEGYDCGLEDAHLDVRSGC